MSIRLRAAALRLLIGAALLPFGIAGGLGAQSVTSGSIEGRIQDTSGAPLRGALISLRSLETGSSRSMRTSGMGHYHFALLEPGRYELRAEALGYRPKRVEGLALRPAQVVRLQVRLDSASLPVDGVSVERLQPTAAEKSSGTGRWFSSGELDELPDERRELTELARLSSISNRAFETEGLPGWLGGIAVDGMVTAATRHPDLSAARVRTPSLPLSGFSAARLVSNPLDVEWSGFAGALLSGHTRRGTGALAVESFGAWSGGPLWSSRFFDVDPLDPSGLWGGMLVSGPLLRDSAHFTLGVEARRLRIPFDRRWELDEALDARLVAVARDSFDVALDPYTRPHEVTSDVLSAFGRFDWQVAARHDLSLRANVGSLPRPQPTSADPGLPHAGTSFDGRDLNLGARLTSDLGGSLAHELRVGLEQSRRSYGEERLGGELDPGRGLPSTWIVAGGLAFGSDAALPGRFEQSLLRASSTLHVRRGDHRLKLGLAAGYASYDHTYTHGRGGQFVFGGPDAFARSEGLFIQSVGGLPVARFDVGRYGIFLQDTWSPAPGIELLLGLRYDWEDLPARAELPSEEWARRVGLLAGAMPPHVGKLSPRLGFTWDPAGDGAWRVEGGAGLYNGEMDPHLLAEFLSHHGGRPVRRGLGALGRWPTVPDSVSAPVTGRRLVLFDSGFRPPRTARFDLGITRRFGETAVHLAGLYRWTRFLPRRRDLNLAPAAAAHDQYGRPIYGDLVLHAGLLAAAPGSNRRFSDFDLVSALESDGDSRYWGMTIGFEREAAGADLFGSYTYSRTTDDWLVAPGGPEAELSPVPDAGAADWADGRSSFDRPHRLVLGASLDLPLPVPSTLAGFYRYSSGQPFTPGFRAGLDANGDGSTGNDPAFVDHRVAGVADLMTRWDCLREQAGRFAERNACRGPGSHTLDLRLAFTVMRGDGLSAELVLDGLNLFESEAALPDRALYLLDAEATTVRDPDTGTVTLPLLANPHFGQPLVRLTSGRLLRIGFRLNH